jgi:hypothetical protein
MEFGATGTRPYVDHIAGFFRGERTVPVSRTETEWGADIFFTFSAKLFLLFLCDLDRIKKPYECALKYGFRGFSKGGKNGIFYLRRQDKNLLRAVEKLKESLWDEIGPDLQSGAWERDELRPVKIVWHSPAGERIVGLMNETNNRIMFLDFARY